MTNSEFDAYRPPEPEHGRRKKRRGGAAGQGSGRRPGRGSRRELGLEDIGTGGGDREMSMVEDVQFDSYYGRPVVKAPPWETPIGIYLFLGGLAGASGVQQLAAHATHRPQLQRNARLVAIGALGIGAPALIMDLGRPERFLHMMRVFKPTSPMSMGTWILSAYGGAAGLLAAIEADRLTGKRLPLRLLRPLVYPFETPAAIGAALLGAPLAAYTAVLLADTSVPTWNAARHGLPYVFVSSATLAAAGSQLVLTSRHETGPARALAVAGVIGDVVGMEYTKSRMHELEAEPLEEGKAGWRMKWAERLAIAGGVGALFAGRSRTVAVASGLALLSASALTRFGVLEAGLESVKDPRRVIEPQKARLAARRARGITDDSITTGW